eukprot:763396-Hanusia_phi.AAC.4
MKNDQQTAVSNGKKYFQPDSRMHHSATDLRNWWRKTRSSMTASEVLPFPLLLSSPTCSPDFDAPRYAKGWFVPKPVNYTQFRLLRTTFPAHHASAPAISRARGQLMHQVERAEVLMSFFALFTGEVKEKKTVEVMRSPWR